MATRAKQIHSILRSLVQATPDLEGAAVVSADGLMLSSALPAGVDEDQVSALAAALLSFGGRRTARESQRGRLGRVYLRGDTGYIILMQYGEESVLEAIAGGETGHDRPWGGSAPRATSPNSSDRAASPLPRSTEPLPGKPSGRAPPRGAPPSPAPAT